MPVGRRTAALLLAGSAFLVASGGAGMALGRTITLFSEVNGRLVDADGRPQPGVTIKQSWREGPDRDFESVETVTDAEGRFHFPAVERRSIAVVFLPSTPVIRQLLQTERPEGTLTLWRYVRRSHAPLDETGGRPLSLLCRIDAEENDEGPAWGTCRLVDNP